MKNFEEDLQNKMEQQKDAFGLSADEKAYQAVFTALRQEPVYKLSPSFADRTVRKVKVRREGRELVWAGAGGILLLVLGVITVMMSGFKLNFGFLNAMSSYKGLLIFAMIFISGLQWLDKKLLRNKRATY